MAGEDVPAWMMCEDIITRLKEELILEAVDILHEEMKAGRVDINGYISLLPDKSGEMQKDIYIIGNLVQREAEIDEQYRSYLEGRDGESDPAVVERIEALGKFMLSVHAISTLMRLSDAAGKWADDTGRYSSLTDQKEIMIRTVRLAEDRLEALDFILSSSRFVKSGALTKEELEMLGNARRTIHEFRG